MGAAENLNIPGALMRAEAAEAPAAFCRAIRQNAPVISKRPGAIYTIARGSSDAAACMLWYEFMAELGIPVTSLPPSIFSLSGGVAMDTAMALVISQSGGSDDLVLAARGARAQGAEVAAITNVGGSPVEAEVDFRLKISAGPENAVPATKSVIGSVGAGMALLASISPDYKPRLEEAAKAFAALADAPAPEMPEALRPAFLRADHVYVIGRGSGFGAAQEIALKLKETCALHAEAYSASEVLHGPLQLVSKPLLVLVLDTGAPETTASLDVAEERFRSLGSTVFRISSDDFGFQGVAAPAAAAALLHALYPVIRDTAQALGYNPDAPETLAKVTRTL